MKAFGKILGLLALVLLLALVAAGFALTYLLDPNDYKEQIRQLAREQVGLELDIDGDIGWSLFPWLGLRLIDTSLASVRTPDQPVAAVHRLDISVQVMPLLQRELRMRSITLDGLELTLTRDEQGQGNWEGIGQPIGTARPPISAPRPTEDTDAGANEAIRYPALVDEGDAPEPMRPLVLDIDRLVITDARVRYQDARTGQQWSIDPLSLTTETIRSGQLIPVHLKAQFNSHQPIVQLQTDWQGQVLLDPIAKRYQIDGLRLTAEASGEALKDQHLNLNLQGELMLDWAKATLDWTGLKLGLNQLRGLGELKVQHLTDAPQWSGALSIAQFDALDFLRSVGQVIPDRADKTALRQLELVTKLSGTAKSAVLDDLQLELDGSHFTGRIAMEDFAHQVVRIHLKGDRLDISRYQPAPEPDKAPKVTEPESEPMAAEVATADTPLPEQPTRSVWRTDKVLPLEPLRRLDAQIQLTLEQLSVAQQPFEGVTLKFRAEAGQLRLEELNGRLHGGHVDIAATLDARPEEPLLGLKATLKNLPLEQLLEAQKTAPVTGLLDLHADLHTLGNTQQAWVDALSGNADFVVDKGLLLKANLEQQLCRAIATLNRKTLTHEPEAKDTAFRELRGSLVIRNGVANNPDLKIAIPGLSIKGHGDLDWRVLGMDYYLGVTVEGDQRDMPDPACQVNKHLARIEWPLHCRGPMAQGAKACRVDKEALAGLATKAANQKITDKLEDKLGDKVTPELKETLKGLFKR